MSAANRGRVERVTATALRMLALGLRFVFLFLLAKFVSVEDFGAYGLLAATAAYLVYIVGMDFYTYANRELIQAEQSRWGGILSSQAGLALILYAVVLPASALLCVFGLLPWNLYVWLVLLVPLEHIGIELDRALISMRKNLYSSIGLFVRQGLAPITTIGLMLLFPEARTLTFALSAWAACNLIGVLVALYFVRKALQDVSRLGRVDWRWIRLGIPVSLLFLAGTVCLRSFFTVDRQVVAAFEGLEMLGSYTFYLTIGSGLTSVVNAGVHQFLYPRLVAAIGAGERGAFKKALAWMALQTMAVLLVLSAISVVLIRPLLSFVGEEQYSQALWMLPWVLLVIGLYNLALVPHFGLYALGSDRSILLITVFATITFVAALLVLIHLGAVPAVLAAIGAGSFVLLVGKSLWLYLAWGKYTRRSNS